MKIYNMIIILIKVTLNIAFMQRLSGVWLSKTKLARSGLFLLLLVMNYGVEIFFLRWPLIVFVLNLIIIIIFLIFYKTKELLVLLSIVLFSFVVTDIIQITSAFLASPILVFSGGNVSFETAATISMIIEIIIANLVYFFLLKRIETIFTSNSRRAKIGICIISGFLEVIFIQFRRQEYQEKNESLYMTMTFFIVFCCVILFFWIWDKREEQRKIRELTSYVHKTSEVIPTIHQLIKDNELFNNNEKSINIIKELQSVCESDLKEVKEESKNLKTFTSTGCIMLDKQLERYLDEANKEEFQLDIMVQASVNQILNDEMIDIKGLLQIVGDLYKNAKKAIKIDKNRQNILLCFGYLKEKKYQISVFDSGIPFPEKILKNFGTRGMTTNGTGNGLADIRKTAENGRASIVVSHQLPQASIFTKEVSVVFDGKANIEID